MKLVVGLGNPGERYARTRHNIGFLAVDALASGQGVSFSKGTGENQVARIRLVGEDVLLSKPQTYMNLSGGAVQALMTWHKIHPRDVYVVVDDVLLDLGRYRVRDTGSHGGHNGLRDIEARIGKVYNRLKIGCGPAPGGWDLADYVLGRFLPEELDFLKKRLDNLDEVFSIWFKSGLAAVAQRYNGPVLRSASPGKET